MCTLRSNHTWWEGKWSPIGVWWQLRRFGRDRNGVAAVEFAVLLPLLLFIFVGMIELVTAVSYDRRVSKTAYSVADLIARSEDVTNDINDIQTAIQRQMTPNTDAPVEVNIGMVVISGNRPEIVWSWASQGTVKWAVGSEPTEIPFADSMLTDGETYLISSADLSYPLMLGTLFSDLASMFSSNGSDLLEIPLGDTFILQPRRVSCVEFNDFCANAGL